MSKKKAQQPQNPESEVSENVEVKEAPVHPRNLRKQREAENK